MSSTFSLARGKAENEGEGFPLTAGQAELATQTHRTEHYAFLEGESKDKNVASQAGEALKTAHLDRSPKQVFEAVGGFSVELDDQEAEQLRQVPSIKSCETDQPLKLTDPIEAEVTRDIVQPAIGIEAPEQRAFQGRVIDGSQKQVKAQQDIKSNNLTSYGDSRASSGEILPYGVRAVWGGQDVSAKGNAGDGCYAFVIDTGVLATTGDLVLNKKWSGVG